MLFYENLDEIIFHRHEMFDVDELIVLSGYVGPKPIERLKTLPFKTEVIYGMYGAEGIGKNLHLSLLKLNNDLPNTEIYYSTLPVHSKCYIWKKNGKFVTALIGSANFSVSGLSNPYKEVLAETTYDTFSPIEQYLKRIFAYCNKCNELEIDFSTKENLSKQNKKSNEYDDGTLCKMSLLNRYGEVSDESGLNWGLARLNGGHTTIGDAYIAITIPSIKNFPELFPPKLGKSLVTSEGAKMNRQNDAVEYVWDDGVNMEGLLEGNQTVDGIKYPKQLCSGPQKNVLGKYLRNRIGISDLDYKISRVDLESYGRTDVAITLQGEGVYALDFSVNC